MGLNSQLVDETEKRIVAFLHQVYPSPLMIKSISALLQVDVREVSSSLTRLSRINVVEQKSGADKRAKYFRLSAWAYSGFK